MALLYSYTARSIEGRFVAGTLNAETREQALAHLRTRALFVTSLAEPDRAGGVLARVLSARPVSRTARVTFVRSLATLVRAGVPLRRALEIVIANCRDARLREALNSVASDVDSGIPLSNAFEKRPAEFPVVFVAMVRAGELGGAVDDVLERIATLMEYETALGKRLRAALAYPAIVTLAAIGLVLFLISNTIPAFANLFAQMHVTLPLTTRALLAVGGALQSPAVYIAFGCGCVALIAAVSASRKSSVVGALAGTLIETVPLVGTIVRKNVLARFSRTLGMLLRTGVPLLGALDASRYVMSNARYSGAIERMSASLSAGSTVDQALTSTGLFNDLVLALVRVGEETGCLDEMLIRIAEYYEVDVETLTTSLAGMVEPLVIVVLGAIVGTIVGSILIPLYSMIGSIK